MEEAGWGEGGVCEWDGPQGFDGVDVELVGRVRMGVMEIWRGRTWEIDIWVES